MIDPRVIMVREKFAAFKYIIPVISGKGGVGKSIISTALSLEMAKKYKTGLLDLDFWGASDHLLLNTKNQFPEEEKGILPEEIRGLKFMTGDFQEGCLLDTLMIKMKELKISGGLF